MKRKKKREGKVEEEVYDVIETRHTQNDTHIATPHAETHAAQHAEPQAYSGSTVHMQISPCATKLFLDKRTVVAV